MGGADVCVGECGWGDGHGWGVVCVSGAAEGVGLGGEEFVYEETQGGVGILCF